MALPPSHDEIEAMARALLAAYEQEPVAVVELSDYVTAAQLSGDEPSKKAVKELYEGALVVGQNLYAHPAPSIPTCAQCNGTGRLEFIANTAPIFALVIQ